MGGRVYKHISMETEAKKAYILKNVKFKGDSLLKFGGDGEERWQNNRAKLIIKQVLKIMFKTVLSSKIVFDTRKCSL